VFAVAGQLSRSPTAGELNPEPTQIKSPSASLSASFGQSSQKSGMPSPSLSTLLGSVPSAISSASVRPSPSVSSASLVQASAHGSSVPAGSTVTVRVAVVMLPTVSVAV